MTDDLGGWVGFISGRGRCRAGPVSVGRGRCQFFFPVMSGAGSALALRPTGPVSSPSSSAQGARSVESRSRRRPAVGMRLQAVPIARTDRLSGARAIGPTSGGSSGAVRVSRCSGGRRLDQTGTARPASGRPEPARRARTIRPGGWPDGRSRPGGRRRPGPNGHGGDLRPVASPAGSDSWSFLALDRGRNGDATTVLGLRHALISGHDVFVAPSQASLLRRPPAAGRAICCSRCCARTENADRSRRSSAGGPGGYRDPVS